METFVRLLSRHLDTFRGLETLQAAALKGVQNQAVESLTDLLAKQGDVMTAIAREKAELKPYLDQWESLDAGLKQELRAGKPGEILMALESIAQSIQARHQDMFGADDSAASGSGQKQGQATGSPPAPDLAQTINIYRALQ